MTRPRPTAAALAALICAPLMSAVPVGSALAQAQAPATKAAPASGSSRAAAAAKPQPLRLDGTVSVFRDATGRVTGCGLRVFGIEELPPPRETYRTVDVSLLLGVESLTQGAGLIKASSFEATPAAMKHNQPTRSFKLTDAWLRADGGERTRVLTDQAISTDEQSRAISYLAYAGALFGVADAALADRPIEVAVQRDGAAPAVFTGTLRISERDKQALVGCTQELAVRAKGGR